MERLILFGEGSLRKAIHEFVEHYHHERNHQGLDNRLIMEEESYVSGKGAIQRRQRLGGTLNYYYRQAARGRTIELREDSRRRVCRSSW